MIKREAMRGKVAIFLRFVIGCVLIFFIVHRFVIFTPGIVERTVSLVVYPFLRLQHTLVRPIHRCSHYLHTLETLEQKVVQLQHEKKELLEEIIGLHSVQWYQGKTKELHSFAQRYNYDEAPCVQILAKQFSPYEHSYLIDYGSVQGAQVDMVALYQNCVVGRIVHVYPYYSKVLLVTDPLCKVPVYCQQSKAPGIYEGLLNEYAGSLRYVNHLYHVVQDELVISSGEGVIFPQGFAVGRVHWFESDGLHYKVVVKPLLSFNDLEYCYVVKKGALPY